MFSCTTQRWGGMVLGLVLVAGFGSRARADLPIEQEPINYLTAIANDPIARLQKQIDRGAVKLQYDEEGQGYLKSVLEHLKVPMESQVLVFSKTSFQHTRISPRTPRAVYFDDNTYVGFVRGGEVLEFSSVDPQLGAVFYSLSQEKTERPTFERQTHACLQCHQSAKTQDVPGHMMRSVFVSRTGMPVFNAGSFVNDDTSPLSERWGGWYVTGTHGEQRHMGNVIVTDRDHPERIDVEAGANRVDLTGLVDTFPYLSRHSDIVALMVLEHQTQLHNLLTLANYQARMGLYYDDGINKAMNQPAGTLSQSTERRIANHADKLVKALLFSGEPRLTDPITGTSGFAERFAAQGPRDPRGRSLRDLDLKNRLFAYPCSFLIYSESFDSLPDVMRARVYHRLREVLTGQDSSPDFAHLSPADRRAVLEILVATKSNLPDDWKSLTNQGDASE